MWLGTQSVNSAIDATVGHFIEKLRTDMNDLNKIFDCHGVMAVVASMETTFLSLRMSSSYSSSRRFEGVEFHHSGGIILDRDARILLQELKADTEHIH